MGSRVPVVNGSPERGGGLEAELEEAGLGGGAARGLEVELEAAGIGGEASPRAAPTGPRSPAGRPAREGASPVRGLPAPPFLFCSHLCRRGWRAPAPSLPSLSNLPRRFLPLFRELRPALARTSRTASAQLLPSAA